MMRVLSKDHKRPLLVRGLSNTDCDEDLALTRLVATALADVDPDGWGQLSKLGDDNFLACVHIKDNSGYGGCKTFKVSTEGLADTTTELPLIVCSPPTVALHSRLSEKTPHVMSRMFDAGLALSKAGVYPRWLAHGSDWFIEEWEQGSADPEKSDEDWHQVGQLIAHIHSVSPDWFDDSRQKIYELGPACVKTVLESLPGSHAWLYLSRDISRPNDDDLFRVFVDSGAIAPQHPITKRIVTTHGDFHQRNLIWTASGEPKVVDLEFTSVSSAVFDLAALGYNLARENSKEAFECVLAGYLGEIKLDLNEYNASEGSHSSDVEISGAPDGNLMLKVDIELAQLLLWHGPGGLMPLWDLNSMEPEDAMQLVVTCKEFAQLVRDTEELQREIVDIGVDAMVQKFPGFQPETQMARGKWYPRVQARLEEAIATENFATNTEIMDRNCPVFVLKCFHDECLALQLRPGTNRLELGVCDIEKKNTNQQWRKLRCGRLQHVATGLFLDCERKYQYHKLKKNWESCGSEVFVRALNTEGPETENATNTIENQVATNSTDSDRQMWHLEPAILPGSRPEIGKAIPYFLRHTMDGRALDVNFWCLEAKTGVNVNLVHSNARGQQWKVDWVVPKDTDEPFLSQANTAFKTNGVWSTSKAERNLFRHTDELFAVPLSSGTEETVLSWVKALVEDTNWNAAITVDKHNLSLRRLHMSATDFARSTAKVNSDARQETGCSDPEVCNDCCIVHTWNPSPLPIKDPTKVRNNLSIARPSIAPCIPAGSVFAIKVTKAPDFCLSYRSNGYTSDPYEIYLARFTEKDQKQLWRLIGGDQLQNVETGLFLHTALHYPISSRLHRPWEKNGTHLVLKEQNYGDEQRWIWDNGQPQCQNEFDYSGQIPHGGHLLRHYKDGRSVDVHMWRITNDGNNMGVEESAQNECTGISYKFEVVDL